VAFFRMSTAWLAIVLLVVEVGVTAIAIVAGHRLRHRVTESREPVGVIQATLLGLVGLLLAFGLSMAVGRYEIRREHIVTEANTIGTTDLRAQTLDELYRTESVELLRDYADAAVTLSEQVPSSRAFATTSSGMESLQRSLWAIAGRAVQAAPEATAPRLYIETLNEMIDMHTSRSASLRNRVPTPVMVLLVVASAVALAALSLYLTLLGRGIVTSLVAAVVVTLKLFITFDLDRPSRGFITIPNTPLVEQRASMDDPPAFIPADF